MQLFSDRNTNFLQLFVKDFRSASARLLLDPKSMEVKCATIHLVIDDTRREVRDEEVKGEDAKGGNNVMKDKE